MMYAAMAEELIKIAAVKLGSWEDYATKQERADIAEAVRQHGPRSVQAISKIDTVIDRHAGGGRPRKTGPSRLGIGVCAIGATALGAGIGTAAGYGVAALANEISKRYAGQPIPMKYVAPAGMLLGGLAGVGMRQLREKTLEDIRNAIKGE